MKQVFNFLLLFTMSNIALGQAPVTYDFTTDVPGFTGGCPACLFENQPVTGSFDYNPDVGPPAISPTGFSIYLGGISSLSGSVGSNSFADDLGLVIVGDDIVAGTRDLLRLSPGLFLEGFEIGGFTLIDARMMWLEGTPGDPAGIPDFLTGQNLPDELPDIPGVLFLDFENALYPGVVFTVGFQNLIVTRAPTNVLVDVKPGTSSNSINPTSKGNIPVAVYTTDVFDATQLNVETIVFGPNAAIESHGRAHIEDIDADGDADLTLHFDTQETGIQCGDAEATLTGTTFSGEAVSGSDAITLVKCQ